jgi:hypothetical protein
MTLASRRFAADIEKAVAELPALATREEVARFLRISTRSLDRRIARKQIAIVKTTAARGRTLIWRHAVATYLEGCLE